MEQPKIVSPHDRLIMSARLAADKEVSTDWIANHQELLGQLEEGKQFSMPDGIVITRQDGKIYFERSGSALEIHEALVDERAMALLFKQRANSGQAILKLMWEFHVKQRIAYRGEDGEEYNPDDLVMYVNKTYGPLMDDNPYYADQLAFVVLRVFQPVYAAQLAGKPFVNENDEQITVESLVDGKKMLGKLLDMSYTFEKADPEDKKELLNAVTTGTQADVKQAKNKINGVGPITGIWVVHSTSNGKYKVEMDDLSEEQVQYLEKALGKGWTQELR